MIRYKTVAQRGCEEQIIDKSRFIAYVAPAETKEEADSFIAEIKSKHKDATHNVPAMVIGEKMQIQWASDDGEPQGTSGAPMVQMLVKEGITNIVVVVTRYFGGIKLGTGGLVRAYTSSAKLGIATAGLCEVKDMTCIDVKVDYTYLAKIQNMAKSQTDNGKPLFEIQDIKYEDTVTIKIATEPECIDEIKEMLTNLTAATAEIVSEEELLVKVKVSE